MQKKARITGTIIIGIVLLGLLVQSCINSKRMMAAIHGPYYQYKFSIREADSRKHAVWEDQKVRLSFSPDYNRINFSLQNGSDQAVEVLWNESSVVRANDSSAVIHQGVTLNNNPRTQAPSVIAPGASLQDFILPLLLIDINGQYLSVGDLYPEKDDSLSVKNDWIMRQIGQDLFKVYLVVKIEGQQRKLEFTFYPREIMRGAHSFKKP